MWNGRRGRGGVKILRSSPAPEATPARQMVAAAGEARAVGVRCDVESVLCSLFFPHGVGDGGCMGFSAES
jgi:hypothetical protein